MNDADEFMQRTRYRCLFSPLCRFVYMYIYIYICSFMWRDVSVHCTRVSVCGPIIVTSYLLIWERKQTRVRNTLYTRISIPISLCGHTLRLVFVDWLKRAHQSLLIHIWNVSFIWKSGKWKYNSFTKYETASVLRSKVRRFDCKR